MNVLMTPTRQLLGNVIRTRRFALKSTLPCSWHSTSRNCATKNHLIAVGIQPPCISWGQHFGSSRYASSYDYGGAGIELPPDMHESMMKYAREIVLQCAALDKAIEEESIKVRDRSAVERCAHMLRGTQELVKKWDDTQEHIKELTEMLKESDLKAMAASELDDCNATLEATVNELAAHLFPPEDIEDKGCIIEVRGGMGGGEGCLFAQEVFAMYENFVRYQGGTFEVTAVSPGPDNYGSRESIAVVGGRNMYGRLRYEGGVHRVQRVPLNDPLGRRQTSTCSVIILPQATEQDIHIEPKDIKFEVSRSGGAGGQGVNTTESAVRAIHIPTGIAVRSETSRSQDKNRARALLQLRTKMYEMEREKAEKETSDLRRSQAVTPDFSEKIRTFFGPGNQLQDHRFNVKLNNLSGIMNDPVETTVFLDRLAAAAKMRVIQQNFDVGPPDYTTQYLSPAKSTPCADSASTATSKKGKRKG